MAKKPDDGSTDTGGDTTESVTQAAQDAAGGDKALTAAVAARNDQPAPPSEFEAFMNEAGRRLDQLEQVLGLAAPFVAMFGQVKSGGLNTSQAIAQAVTGGQAIIGQAVPSAAPVLARLPALEKTIADMLGAFGVHFGAKSIEGLPTTLHPAAPAD